MPTRLSPENLRLLNPAFVGLVIAKVASGFAKETGSALPFVYAFVATPLVLHAETRDRLPSSIVTRLVPWTERNADLMTLFPRRVADVAPTARRGLLLALSTSMLRLRPKGEIEAILGESKIAKYAENSGSSEIQAILAKATFVGRWLSSSGLPSTVLTTLGIAL